MLITQEFKGLTNRHIHTCTVVQLLSLEDIHLSFQSAINVFQTFAREYVQTHLKSSENIFFYHSLKEKINFVHREALYQVMMKFNFVHREGLYQVMVKC